MTITAYRVEVFGAKADKGNPAVVVLGAEERPELLQAIATKAAVSDTAFIWPDPTSSRVKIRWFTPKAETTLCGHATLAAARVLRESDAASPLIEFESARDRLIVTHEGGLDWLTLPPPVIEPLDRPRQSIADALQIWGSETELKLPTELTPERDLIIPLSLAADLYHIEPDFELLAKLGREWNVRGFCLLDRKHRDPDVNFAIRFFAPHYGIPEDPATGSVVGPLALYAVKHGWAAKSDSPLRLQFEQGAGLGRPCRLHVEFAGPGMPVLVGGLTSVPAAMTLGV